MGTWRLKLKSAWKNSSAKNTLLQEGVGLGKEEAALCRCSSRSDFPDGSKVSSMQMLNLLVNIASIRIAVIIAGVMVQLVK